MKQNMQTVPRIRKQGIRKHTYTRKVQRFKVNLYNLAALLVWISSIVGAYDYEIMTDI